MQPMTPVSSDEEWHSARMHAVAAGVLSTLRARRRALPTPCGHPEMQAGVAALIDELVAPQRFDAVGAVARLRASGLSRRCIAERLVPAAADRLGECWTGDALGFAQVTVGAHRLQGMLGTMMGEQPALHGGQLLLALTFAEEHHTLGWKLLTYRLRQRGVATHAVPGVSPEEAAMIAARQSYDGVLVSASRNDAIDGILRFQRAMAAGGRAAPPVVLGGLLAARLDPAGRPGNIAAVTNCIDQALGQCAPLTGSHRLAGE